MTQIEGHSRIIGMAARTIGATPGSLDPTAGLECAAIVLKAADANSGTVYVGHEGVTTANGFPLTAGQALEIAINNTASVWVVGSAASQIVNWIALARG